MRVGALTSVALALTGAVACMLLIYQRHPARISTLSANVGRSNNFTVEEQGMHPIEKDSFINAPF